MTRSKKIHISIPILIFILIIGLYAINFAGETKNLKVSDDFFNALNNTDFTNEETLTRLGFENREDYYVLHSDSDEFLCAITLSFGEKKESGLKKHGDILYKAEEVRTGILSPKRLFEKDLYVIRRCVFYKGNACIKITEDNSEKSELEFERFIINNWK